MRAPEYELTGAGRVAVLEGALATGLTVRIRQAPMKNGIRETWKVGSGLNSSYCTFERFEPGGKWSVTFCTSLFLRDPGRIWNLLDLVVGVSEGCRRIWPKPFKADA
jgi:hypothetical protein